MREIDCFQSLFLSMFYSHALINYITLLSRFLIVNTDGGISKSNEFLKDIYIARYLFTAL